jgi:hypothetical protein
MRNCKWKDAEMGEFKSIDELRKLNVMSPARGHMDLLKQVYEIDKIHEKLDKTFRETFCYANRCVQTFDQTTPKQFIPVSTRLTHVETWLLFALIGLVALAIVNTGHYKDREGRMIECSPILYYYYFSSLDDKTEEMKKHVDEALAFTILIGASVIILLITIIVFVSRRKDM